jgi:hypothetical protein
MSFLKMDNDPDPPDGSYTFMNLKHVAPIYSFPKYSADNLGEESIHVQSTGKWERLGEAPACLTLLYLSFTD